MIDTTDIQAGDTLVNDDGSVTIQIDAINGATVEVTDSRATDWGDLDIAEVRDAIESGDFAVVRDSKLTAIKGVGAATAPKLEAATGCETPEELADAYLTDPDAAVHEHVPRRDHFTEWLLDNVENLDVDATTDQVRVLLFLTEFGCSPHASSLTSKKATNDRYGSVDEAALTLDDLRWEEGEMWTDAANVALLALGTGALDKYQWYDQNQDDYVPAESAERDGDYYVVTASGNETWVSTDYLEGICEIFRVNPDESIRAYRGGQQPILIEIADSDLIAVLAPRVRND